MKVSGGILAVVLHLCAGSDIVVTPSTHQFVALNSTDNVTYTCNVTGSDQNRSAVWEIQELQILNDESNSLRRSFANLGITVQVVVPGITELIITPEARLSYLNGDPSTPNITVQCALFSNNNLPLGEVGEKLNVTTFGIPSVPTGLSLDPNPEDPTQLIFSWEAPKNTLAGVITTYVPGVTDLNFNLTENTFLVFDDDASLECLPRNFSIFASNAAGNGQVAFITDTIPLSPNISSLDSGFQISRVNLADNVSVVLSFPPAESCNPRFPILNYTLHVMSVPRQRPLNFSPEQNPIVVSLTTGLELDRSFQVYIEACISINCRQSQTQVLRTTDVQAAQIVFYETNVFITCTFALGTNARGCVVTLLLQNSSESFNVSRSGLSGGRCNQTMNQHNAYMNFTAVDIESDGDSGAGVLYVLPQIIEDAEAYTNLTGCGIPEPEPALTPALTPGAIAGIVIAVVIVGAVVLVVIVLLLVYRVRTGHWFKLREKDEANLILDFEKELLVGDDKPKKKAKVAAASDQSYPDNGAAEGELALASPVEPANVGVEEQDAAISTNPKSAFTLDISSDRRKVKLHLNKALIKRVLQEKNLKTMERKQARRQNSMAQHLLPLHYCEVRVEVEEDQSNNS